MADKCIWIRGKRYNLYGTYGSPEEAKRIAIAKKKQYKNKVKTYVMKTEIGGIIPYNVYRLYITKIITIW